MCTIAGHVGNACEGVSHHVVDGQAILLQKKPVDNLNFWKKSRYWAGSTLRHDQLAKRDVRVSFWKTEDTPGLYCLISPGLSEHEDGPAWALINLFRKGKGKLYITNGTNYGNKSLEKLERRRTDGDSLRDGNVYSTKVDSGVWGKCEGNYCVDLVFLRGTDLAMRWSHILVRFPKFVWLM